MRLWWKGYCMNDKTRTMIKVQYRLKNWVRHAKKNNQKEFFTGVSGMSMKFFGEIKTCYDKTRDVAPNIRLVVKRKMMYC